jgi:hypothetical protein
MSGISQRNLGLLLCLLAASSCSLFESTKSSEVPQEKASCVEDMEAAKAAKFDADSDLNARVSATLVGTVVLQQSAEKADQDLAQLCDSLARELGGDVKDSEAPAGERAKASCPAAMEQIKAARAKAGATLVTELRTPTCSARSSDFEICARECDPNLPPEFKVGCAPEATSGRCEAKCTGTCFENSTDDCDAVCRGTCQGKCMDGFFGSCGGKCIGDCDGKTSNGKCAGTCDGKCTSQANGSCESKCEGKCAGACLEEMKGKECKGSCLGSCSETFSDVRCGEMLAPEEMAPECRAQCDAELSSRLTCNAGFADVTVFSAAERDKAEQLRASLSRTFGNVLTVETGNVAQLKRSAEGLTTSLGSIEESAASNPTLEKKAKGCLEAARTKQEKAIKTLDAFVETSAALVEATKQ